MAGFLPTVEDPLAGRHGVEHLVVDARHPPTGGRRKSAVNEKKVPAVSLHPQATKMITKPRWADNPSPGSPARALTLMLIFRNSGFMAEAVASACRVCLMIPCC
jgi:hypothetical protein